MWINWKITYSLFIVINVELYNKNHEKKIKDLVIRGIKGITQVLPTKKQGKYVILCAGSNLKDVLNN